VAPGQLLALASRYTFSRRGAYLSSFLSLLSILGIVLAITLLIIVLSVMNGFDREMREHILGVVPQLTLKSYVPVADWEQQIALLERHPEVTGAAPFLQVQAMLVHAGNIDTTMVNGISLAAEERVGALQRVLSPDELDQFRTQPRGILLGVELARRLALERGARLTLIVPGAAGAATSTHYQHLQVSGLIDSGTELDQVAAFVHLPMASELAGTGGAVHGFRLVLVDLFAAGRVGWELVSTLPAGFYASDWTMTHGNLYAAIQLSRDLIGILLLSIIAIAAFNVVSSLVLVVVDKQSDIAILRAQGATPNTINGIFLLQGLLIAVIGSVIGSALGIAGSYWVGDIVGLIETLFNVQFLTTDIYPVSYLPSDLRLEDVLAINLVTVIMCFLAALYPARRAAKLPPAEALRHE
jgi:lipoprotein-releasing system permease protein